MAIIGLGTDIVEIARLDAEPVKLYKLAKRILTESEILLFDDLAYPQNLRYLAKRFAAKEAAVKALGTGIGRGIGWQQISISNNAFGAPELHFSGEFARLNAIKGVNRCHLSISDEQDYAVATVILEQS
jgi:holo-[acyl-carrier protein] synthase